MAFNFPDPTLQQTVTNEETGVTYQWKEPPGKWVVVTNPVDDSQLDALTDRVTTLEGRPLPKDYMIGTDKNITRITEPRARPSIELVDSEGYFSNVIFEATGGIAITSTAAAIVIDGSGVSGSADLDDYYTKSEVDNKISELEVTKGTARRYVIDGIIASPTIREGKMHIDNGIVGMITLISLGQTDENGLAQPTANDGDTIELVRPSNGSHYRYKILRAISEMYEVEYIDGTSNADMFFENQPLDVYIYPTQVNVADYYTKEECDDTFVKQTDQAYVALQTTDQQLTQSFTNLNQAHVALNSSHHSLHAEHTALAVEVDQNEEQLQAMVIALLSAQTKIEALQGLDIQNALSELSQARQDIIELKSKVSSLEQQIVLNLE